MSGAAILRRNTILAASAVFVATVARASIIMAAHHTGSASESDLSDLSELESEEPSPRPAKRARKARLTNDWKVGPHVSAAGGVENSILNAAFVGANAFALFLKSQRKWTSPPLKETSILAFKARMKTFGYSASHILPHGSYLVNLGNPDEKKREQSYECFLDDLKRCEELGLLLYNFHPGSTVGVATKEESQSLIAGCINRAHKETERVVIVLENMVGGSLVRGNVIGSTFAELGAIIAQVEDKSRVGVCLDTSLSRLLQRLNRVSRLTVAEFERDVGLQYLRGMHLNDSKGALGSKKDRHENIGLGELGLSTFAHVLSDPRTRDLPLILETPAYDEPGTGASRLGKEGMDVWRKEVEVLNRVGSGEGEQGKMDVWTEEIQEVVENASTKRGAKGKSVKGKAGGGRKRKTGKRKRGEQEDAEEDDGVACASCSEGG
ncbi:xylose isomerase-like protein [Fomitopsis serialis]|uniref:xylose isomerase-like protein n=1 Tax=Fomitopsis serialis TaxID=139415 RepID=UPI002008D3E0|nr:xylose isomerase-like protein [Neoantrodia serialis]KAH9928083.1 xylose isomerase-like protein [Neoantrodia serialis]